MIGPERRTTGPVTFTRVQHTAERVAIIASGPSLTGVVLNIPHGVDVISVNQSFLHLPFAPRFWFTMDTSVANRAIMKQAYTHPRTAFYAAVYPFYGNRSQKRPDLCPPLEESIHYLRRIENPGPRGSRRGLSLDRGGIYVGNSAFGAMGLAFLMGARKIALLGVDGTGGYAWGNGRPRNLRNLRDLFVNAVEFLKHRHIEVIVGSPNSVVDCWPRVSPTEALDWLAQESERAA